MHVEIKMDSIVTQEERDVIREVMKPVVPPVGSLVELGGFTYRVRKITENDLILRPVG